jgi:hypothetical protein
MRPLRRFDCGAASVTLKMLLRARRPGCHSSSSWCCILHMRGRPLIPVAPAHRVLGADGAADVSKKLYELLRCLFAAVERRTKRVWVRTLTAGPTCSISARLLQSATPGELYLRPRRSPAPEAQQIDLKAERGRPEPIHDVCRVSHRCEWSSTARRLGNLARLGCGIIKMMSQ